jgi:uncharacterized protein YbjT (DUF2867 family)
MRAEYLGGRLDAGHEEIGPTPIVPGMDEAGILGRAANRVNISGMAATKRSILVIGATGTVGSRVVAELVARGEAVKAATREPGRARDVLPPGVVPVELDLERPETFGSALEGIDRAFLIARPGDEEADRVALPLIDAMRAAGVRHVTDLSTMGVERMPDVALRRIEQYLEASGIASTHLRPNFFMQAFSVGPLQAGIVRTSAIGIPAGDARVSYVDARDIAAVAAVTLTEPGHEGRAYTLTGPEAIDHHEVARVLSGAAGRPIGYIPTDEDEARRTMAAAGLSTQRIERLVGFYRAVRAGACAPVSPDVPAVLGRPAITFERFAANHASYWR